MAVKRKLQQKRRLHQKRKLQQKRRLHQKRGYIIKKQKKPAFGGYAISFSGRTETVEQVFGNKPIAPSEMTKKIWAL